MIVSTDGAAARWQFSLRDLLLATALVSLYTAAFVVPLRGVKALQLPPLRLAGLVIQTAVVVLLLFRVVRRRSLRKIEPAGIELTANVLWTRLFVIAGVSFGFSMSASLLHRHWQYAALGTVFPFAALSVMFVLLRRVVIGRNGLVLHWDVIRWSVLEIHREPEGGGAVLRCKWRHSDFHCHIPLSSVERIETLRSEWLDVQRA